MFVRCVFFFKQKTAYEMRISDWSSDVCSSDLRQAKQRDGDYSKGLGDGGFADERDADLHERGKRQAERAAPAGRKAVHRTAEEKPEARSAENDTQRGTQPATHPPPGPGPPHHPHADPPP